MIRTFISSFMWIWIMLIFLYFVMAFSLAPTIVKSLGGFPYYIQTSLYMSILLAYKYTSLAIKLRLDEE